MFTDSRQVDNFGKILENQEATEYLERANRPNMDFALRIAGADIAEIISLIEQAADNAALALTRAHLYPDSTRLKDSVRLLDAHVRQLSKVLSNNPNHAALEED